MSSNGKTKEKYVPLFGGTQTVMISISVERWAQVELLIERVNELQQELRRERDPLLSGPQVAAALGITPSAFRGWRDRHPELDALGKGPGKLRRWRLSDVSQWLESRPALQRAVVRKAELTKSQRGRMLDSSIEKASSPTVPPTDED